MGINMAQDRKPVSYQHLNADPRTAAAGRSKTQIGPKRAVLCHFDLPIFAYLNRQAAMIVSHGFTVRYTSLVPLTPLRQERPAFLKTIATRNLGASKVEFSLPFS